MVLAWHRSLGLWVTGIIAFWTLLAVYSIHASMPENAVRLPLEKELHVRLWAPQGWKFFTREAREERTLCFVRSSTGEWVSALRTPNARVSNALGLNRAGRAQGVEIGLLINQLGKEDWRPCDGNTALCVKTAPIVKELRNISPEPTLCGSIGLVMQAPVPWAWSAQKKPVVMPSRIARVEVRC